MQFSKLMIKSIPQKVMVNFGFRRRFHDLKFYEVGFFFFFFFFFFIILEFVINLRASLQSFVGKHQFNVILSCFKQLLENYVVNISTCTLLALSSTYVNFSWKTFGQHKLLGFVDQCVFSNVHDFFLHNIQS